MKFIKKNMVYVMLLLYTFLLVVFIMCNHQNLIVAADTDTYTVVAENLIEEHAFLGENKAPDTFRTPGYPLFIAMLFLISDSLYLVIAAQIILAVLCLYLVYRICIMMNLKSKYALICCLVYILDLGLYIYTSYVLTDAFFFFCLVIATFFLVKYITKKRFLNFVLFIILINFALAVRPILIYYNLLICILLFVLLLMKKVRLKYLIISFLLFATVFGGWSLRNYEKGGVFIYSDVRNINMLGFDAAVLRQRVENVSNSEARKMMNDDFEKKYPKESIEGLTASQKRVLKGKVGKEYIRAHFKEYIIQNITGLFNTLLGPNRSFIIKTVNNKLVANIIMILYVGYLLTVYLLYVFGWIMNFKKANTIDFFLLTISGYCAVASASLGYARFRVAFFGLLVLGAFIIWKDRNIIEYTKETIITICNKVKKP